MTVLRPASRPPRSIARVLTVTAAAAALTMAAACSSDSVSAPKSNDVQFNSAQLKLLDLARGSGNSLTPAVALERTDALLAPVSTSVVIGRNGGKIELKDLGLKLTVPSGAILANSITITVTALAGKQVAYEFQPHGTVFLKALKFEQSTDNTSWDKLKVRGTVMGGYFQNADQLNLWGLAALLNETYPITVDGSKLSFDVWHFSGYMVSTGRADDSDSSQF